jgi:hypothetical protein
MFFSAKASKHNSASPFVILLFIQSPTIFLGEKKPWPNDKNDHGWQSQSQPSKVSNEQQIEIGRLRALCFLNTPNITSFLLYSVWGCLYGYGLVLQVGRG